MMANKIIRVTESEGDFATLSMAITVYAAADQWTEICYAMWTVLVSLLASGLVSPHSQQLTRNRSEERGGR